MGNIDLTKYIVGQYMMTEIGTDKYNVYFTEYYVPAENEDDIAVLKEDGYLTIYDLTDGSIHFSIVNYTTSEEQTEVSE